MAIIIEASLKVWSKKYFVVIAKGIQEKEGDNNNISFSNFSTNNPSRNSENKEPKNFDYYE